MKGRFLLSSNESFVEGNIYADRSSVILAWLLRIGIDKEKFSLRQVAKETGISLGLVQRVFSILVMHGFLQTEGVRTSKHFCMTKPEALLRSWLEQYSIVKKCKMWTYRSGFTDRDELLKVLKKSNLQSKTVLALHSAVEVHGCKNTNLTTLELYIKSRDVKKGLELLLELEPQERGYEVLLIEPYYKSFLKIEADQHLNSSPVLLTFLDLYHFPLRGLEQAEFMAERIPELKRIYRKG